MFGSIFKTRIVRIEAQCQNVVKSWISDDTTSDPDPVIQPDMNMNPGWN